MCAGLAHRSSSPSSPDDLRQRNAQSHGHGVGTMAPSGAFEDPLGEAYERMLARRSALLDVARGDMVRAAATEDLRDVLGVVERYGEGVPDVARRV